MHKTLKQNLNLNSYFVKPITLINIWVTVGCFALTFLVSHMMKKNDRQHMPALRAKLENAKTEKKEVLEQASQSKYQDHKKLGKLVGIIPKNEFFKESQLSFFGELHALSKEKIQDTWLTKIVLNRKTDSMELKGYSITPKYIQDLTSLLERSSAFDDYDTDDLVSMTDSTQKRSRNKNGHIRKYAFVIRSK